MAEERWTEEPMPETVGLCPEHPGEFYMSDSKSGDVCPQCPRELVIFVRASRFEEVQAERDELWAANQALASDHYFQRAERAEAERDSWKDKHEQTAYVQQCVSDRLVIAEADLERAQEALLTPKEARALIREGREAPTEDFEVLKSAYAKLRAILAEARERGEQ